MSGITDEENVINLLMQIKKSAPLTVKDCHTQLDTAGKTRLAL